MSIIPDFLAAQDEITLPMVVLGLTAAVLFWAIKKPATDFFARRRTRRALKRLDEESKGQPVPFRPMEKDCERPQVVPVKEPKA